MFPDSKQQKGKIQDRNVIFIKWNMNLYWLAMQLRMIGNAVKDGNSYVSYLWYLWYLFLL